MTVTDFHHHLDLGNFEVLINLRDELSESLLISYDDVGKTAINKIADAAKVHQVPKELLTKKVLLAESAPETWIDMNGEEETEADSAIDCIIRRDQFSELPEELKIAKILMHPLLGGWRPIHTAACYGKLPQLPQKIITKENLAKHNNFGTNCYHLAACNGYLSQIPSEFLTMEILLEKDKENITVLELAFNKDQEQLLRLNLDERSRPIIGDFLDIINQQRNLPQQNEESPEIDLF